MALPEPSIPDEDFVQFMRSGLTGPSVEALRPNIPRWRHRLAEWGVMYLPHWHTQVPHEARAVNLMTLLIRQSCDDRDPSIEHELRNLTRIRPHKP
jgi:hypothetical protein